MRLLNIPKVIVFFGVYTCISLARVMRSQLCSNAKIINLILINE